MVRKTLLSPYDYWQYWRNTDDRDVVKFLRMFTDIEINQIDKLRSENINDLKIILANETTTMLHGKEAAKKAERTAEKTFKKGMVGEDLPTLKLEKEKIESGLNLIDLVVTSKLLNSKSEVRRTIKNKGIKINNQTIQDEKFVLKVHHFENKNFIKLSHGKNHIIIKMI